MFLIVAETRNLTTSQTASHNYHNKDNNQKIPSSSTKSDTTTVSFISPVNSEKSNTTRTKDSCIGSLNLEEFDSSPYA